MYEKELKRAERLLENEFGTEWKKIVQTLGVWDLTHCIGRDLTSFIAYPERGSGGSSNWQGNCSPEVIRQITQYVRECQTHRRKEDFLLLDPMCGSGTSGDVAADLGIQCVQYDLNPELPCGLGGWNALKDDVEDSADLVFLHPPYHSIIRYSGNMWGKPHADDLSRCDNYADFIEKLNHVIKKLFFSLRSGGVLALLVGDIRQNGEFHSIANDVMTIGTMKSWIVKAQFSCSSSSRSYHSRHPLIPIVTEHLLLFQKENVFQIPYSFRKSGFFYLQKQDSKALTWFHLVCAVMEHLGEDNPVFGMQVLQKHKTIQKCMNYIMEQAYEIAKKEHEKKTSGKQPATGRNQNVALGISELQVYQWAEDYYALDDAKKEAEERAKEQKKRVSKQKKSIQRKTQSSSSEKPISAVPTKNTVPPKKKQPENIQLSLFDMTNSDS